MHFIETTIVVDQYLILIPRYQYCTVPSQRIVFVAWEVKPTGKNIR